MRYIIFYDKKYHMKFFFPLVLLFCFGSFACKTQVGNEGSSAYRYNNHLVNESSPYLLQHAHNPVDWYPWGEKALDKAKKDGKLIIISIGYAACHWCHVMEHESFEDTTVSKIMNDHFVNIKVDREERPDVDDVYMTACHLASDGSCGWPLNSLALPDGRPFWAGTYFPKDQWMEILNHFQGIYEKNPSQLYEWADQLTDGITLSEQIELQTGDLNFDQFKIEDIAKTFISTIDLSNGGRKGSPKFPMPNNYDFLLRYYGVKEDPAALQAVMTTLDKMADGGIYDHLGGGFSRYSTDEKWKVPHFEKMLYDNGQLVSLYSNAYQAQQNPYYKKVVSETLAFIERELSDKSGGFYSSLDADSEGEEGKFYTWTETEINEIIGDEELAKLFNEYYSVTKSGNWEDHNILFKKKKDEYFLEKYNLSETDLNDKINLVRSKLMKVRDQRIRPGTDDKILTSWNALMLKGYVDAYKAFGNPAYLKRALKNAVFIEQEMREGNRLNRNFKDGKSVINGFLDDYALLIDAYIALYQVTFDQMWLNKAKSFNDYAIEHFFDKSTGLFFYTSDLDPPLIARKKELSDNVIPASNSIMARNLFHLGTYFYNQEYIDKSKQMLLNVVNKIQETEQPSFYSNWCNLLLSVTNTPYEIAIVGPNAANLRNQLMTNHLPNAMLLGGTTEGTLELLQDKLQEGETYIYVCQNKSCKLPVTEVGKALELMK